MKFVVKSTNWKDEYSINDMLQEAAVRSLRQHKSVGVIMECQIKTPGRKLKSYYFNTYFILKLAGKDKEAKLIRKIFLKQYGIDLSKESKYVSIT